MEFRLPVAGKGWPFHGYLPVIKRQQLSGGAKRLLKWILGGYGYGNK
ncbi:MAG: hypothetical protein HFG59_13665 [Lachnospiraceae bacterium]|nr:hypothetical protein [Lachnospiraceae bacterium]